MNHHGRVRKVGEGEQDEENEETEVKVMKNNWVENSEQLELDLISRREDVQVCIFFFFYFFFWPEKYSDIISVLCLCIFLEYFHSKNKILYYRTNLHTHSHTK